MHSSRSQTFSTAVMTGSCGKSEQAECHFSRFPDVTTTWINSHCASKNFKGAIGIGSHHHQHATAFLQLSPKNVAPGNASCSVKLQSGRFLSLLNAAISCSSFKGFAPLCF